MVFRNMLALFGSTFGLLNKYKQLIKTKNHGIQSNTIRSFN